MSIAAVVENAAIADATPNTPAPMRRSLRLPILSPMLPIVMSELAIMNP
jgi:hypothetical protein